MAELTRLIKNLQKGIAGNAPYVTHIQDPPGLLRALQELAGMLGHEHVKDRIATQTYYLIQKRAQGRRDKPPMLNTLLYGGPGTGKTSIGTKMAKIWRALGFLQARSRPASLLETVKRVNYAQIYAYVLALIAAWGIISAAAIWCCKKIGVSGLIIGIAAIVVLVLLLGGIYWAYNSYFYRPAAAPTDSRAEVAEKESDVIVITSREDFIGQYLGTTGDKTRKLLERSLGKVLFIDEAYSLNAGDRDMYGIEALDVINRFMSEHPGEIVVIMAGYEDLMKKRIFAYQRGLYRRFMWHFSCEGYSPEELFEIFRLQLGPDWRLSDPEQAKEVFCEHPGHFPSQAGDTERLAFFSQLENSKDVVSSREALANVLTTGQLRRALMELQRNNIGSLDEAAPEKASSLEDFLQALSSRRDGASGRKKGWVREWDDDKEMSDAELRQLISETRGSKTAR